MSKRKSRDEAEPSREFPNPFAEFSGGQLVDASGKVEILKYYGEYYHISRVIGSGIRALAEKLVSAFIELFHVIVNFLT